MNEHDYNCLLNVVSDAFNEQPADSLWSPGFDLPFAANDNDVVWALAPFPEGWEASC
jgi:hypothetical protein